MVFRMGTGLLSALRRLARPLRWAHAGGRAVRLWLLYGINGIEAIEADLRLFRRDTAAVLRRFGADVAADAIVIGPLSLINARGDFSNLRIGSRTHIGSEVFLDLADRVTIEEGATLSMRSCILSHLDVGHGPLARIRPPEKGPVTIGAGAYLGVGAIVLHGLVVGSEAIVGAGSLVREDVPPGRIVGGVPARELPAGGEGYEPAGRKATSTQ